MSGLLRRLAFVTAVALLLLSGFGFARASLASVDEIATVHLTPSDAPALLGPITELGRTGWQCIPERVARALTAHDADLPSDPGR